ncbi:MAG TPA: phytanoyl-CoA dioxygenase family protein [Planctomycetota bacterium]|nr:phytanoyl-CoA dioxygenase family protein [Planctomycetota bacterium]
MPILDRDAIRADFDRDGYAVARGLFSREEIAEFRRRVQVVRERELREGRNIHREAAYPNVVYVMGDVLARHELEDVAYVVFDPRVQDLVRALVGPSPVYWGDSSVQVGGSGQGWHRDNVHRTAHGDDWAGGRYDVIRVGVYLQDHSRHSGGVKIGAGSHAAVENRGTPRNVGVEPGDVAVWTLRTYHSANFVRLKGFPDACLPPIVERFIPGFLRVPEERERMSIFCSFGGQGAHTDRYIAYQAARADAREYFRRSCLGPAASKTLGAAGVEFRRPIPEYGELHACAPAETPAARPKAASAPQQPGDPSGAG